MGSDSVYTCSSGRQAVPANSRFSPDEELFRSASMSVCKAAGLPFLFRAGDLHNSACGCVGKTIWWQTIPRSATIIQKTLPVQAYRKIVHKGEKKPWSVEGKVGCITRTHVIPTTWVSWGWAARNSQSQQSSTLPPPVASAGKWSTSRQPILSSLAVLHCNRGSYPAPGRTAAATSMPGAMVPPNNPCGAC